MRLIDAYLLGEFTKTINGRAYVPYDVIMSMTPVDAKPVRYGKWIKVDDDEPIAYDCSKCDAQVSRPYNYCPKCGAKMVRR